MRGRVPRGRANRATAPCRSFFGQPGGRTGGEEAELPIGPVSVGPTAVEVLRPVMIQVAALTQGSEVEQGRCGRGAVVDVRRREHHAAARGRVRLMIAGAAPLTPIPGPHHAHEPGPHRPIQGIPAPHVPRRVVHSYFQGSGFLHDSSPLAGRLDRAAPAIHPAVPNSDTRWSGRYARSGRYPPPHASVLRLPSFLANRSSFPRNQPPTHGRALTSSSRQLNEISAIVSRPCLSQHPLEPA